MKLSHFSYKLPDELIADRPTINRDDSRLMVVDRKTGEFEHKMFHEIIVLIDRKTKRINRIENKYEEVRKND